MCKYHTLSTSVKLLTPFLLKSNFEQNNKSPSHSLTFIFIAELIAIEIWIGKIVEDDMKSNWYLHFDTIQYQYFQIALKQFVMHALQNQTNNCSKKNVKWIKKGTERKKIFYEIFVAGNYQVRKRLSGVTIFGKRV